MIDQQWLADRQSAAPLGVFVEGERCTWHGETAVQLGRLLGQLHSLQPPTNVPNSWYPLLWEGLPAGCGRRPASPLNASEWFGGFNGNCLFRE